MAFPHSFLPLLFAFILLPSSPLVLSSIDAVVIPLQQSQTLEDMITRACDNVENRGSCLENIRSKLENDRYHDTTSILKAAMHNSLNEVRLAMDALSKFTTLSVSPREQIAIRDCQELLDFSVTELAWSMKEMREMRTTHPTTNPSSEGNLKAWLSAALSNQDTCLEGFEGTDKRLVSFIKGSLTQVTQLINNVLKLYVQLRELPFKPPINETSRSDFPSWMTDGDKEMVVSSKPGIGMHVDAIVALDGSGHYRSIAQAVFAAPSYSNRRYVIYVKKGIYHENVDMKKKKTNIMLVGDGIGVTVVTGNRNFMQGWTTFRTATVAVSGKGFIARDMTFRNTAGPQNFQAVALRVDSDQSAFFRCSMEGYQDTLYAHSLRQFFRECSIYGTIDFIFGNGAAVLQNCRIFTRQPLPQQKVTITAQGRKSPDQGTGFSIQDSYIYASQPTYLGRPWKQFSRTVYINTFMSRMVQPRGWLEWYGDFALNTLWYGEYRNYGPGASLAGRIKWPGYHVIRNAPTATYFTVQHFIDGMSWLPSTGIKFSAGLTNR
ncbi:unnamed protein product [Cuscuta epithymum]|uniref:Pectinesterase n=2 Tax=Cuscuta epithymum TaxID=186058 RepID=A0AAV0CII1_9ASTE|nr:unnamed protein product [Cuscuta epithymum]